jgi:hypothetical protein
MPGIAGDVGYQPREFGPQNAIPKNMSEGGFTPGIPGIPGTQP